MDIGVIGLGYVGVTMALFLSDRYMVYGIEANETKLKKLKEYKLTFYEKGLASKIKRNKKKLRFISSSDDFPQTVDLIIVCVNTPQRKDGSCNPDNVYDVIHSLKGRINDHVIIVIRSTVEVGTTRKIQNIIYKQGMKNHVVFVPEFLSQGSAMHDVVNPSRTIIGGVDADAINRIKQVLVRNERCLETTWESAEMIKYASNAFLATKISFINEIANLCEKTNADIKDVSRGIGYDPRIGEHFLKAGVGYGGSCLGKDINSLICTGQQHNADMCILKSVKNVNEYQRTKVVDLADQLLNGVAEKTCVILGLSFKPGTDDVRDSPSLEIVHALRQRRAAIKVYDPLAMQNYQEQYDLLYKESITNDMFAQSIEDALRDADLCIILTEWDEICSLTAEIVISNMSRPIIIDGRNCLNLDSDTEIQVYNIGRSRNRTNKKF